ncbi:hypothetical protein LKD70_10350 [Ruminococcus sp. CLA-AA-H200]|uniref:Uncharacterized protein n=1 Tax=Ruminococcus turbiniformis TaxID=2881258 RepID=A0ABS8FYY6_9FIRM|nr:hypothetical protein [Ruminococcus turbiniformis]MCC2254814.1 hypothetical protein [Ruminococcus turbiniformis]
MKNWETPKMKVYSVKMDENIAASGDGGYQVAYIYYDEGGITRGGANYNWSGNNMIQDTSVSFTGDGGVFTVPYSQMGAISGCLA